MAFWVDAAGRAPGSGRVRKTVASGRHAGYPTGMAAKTTSRDGDSLSYYVITSVTWDGMPDSAFKLPEAVRATLRGDRAKG